VNPLADRVVPRVVSVAYLLGRSSTRTVDELRNDRLYRTNVTKNRVSAMC